LGGGGGGGGGDDEEEDDDEDENDEKKEQGDPHLAGGELLYFDTVWVQAWPTASGARCIEIVQFTATTSWQKEKAQRRRR